MLFRKGSNMCQPKRCSVCGKTTWSGCGMHVDAVKAAVPAGEWCDGHPKADRPTRLKFWK
ncbi:hypothetical protein C1S79_09105 [Mycolicibacterium phocaicum]|uniref:Uncharacterized protein n=1 Tax=Mycolicibacterium phocaicum TaxID=319706 RepID=A0AA94UF31_9MYCO|nr:hypothetical protein C1S79_09105 [Mycolicibacterium phocaicum]